MLIFAAFFVFCDIKLIVFGLITIHNKQFEDDILDSENMWWALFTISTENKQL